MSKKMWAASTALCMLAMATMLALPANAQMSDSKEKPPMYSYVSIWTIPRAQWGEMGKAGSANDEILKKALADGTLVAYGNDEEMIHQPDGSTHDSWWSATSMAGADQRARPVLQVGQRDVNGSRQRHQALGYSLRQPPLQLAWRDMEGRVYPCVFL